MTYKRLQQMYAGNDFYWGTEPNEFAIRTLKVAPKPGLALDLGAGEGRDSVLFAQNRFDTLAVDVSDNALAKAKRLAVEKDVSLQTEASDLNTYEPHEKYDLIYSIGTVQYIAPENRKRQFDRLGEATNPGGINAIFSFVKHPEIPSAPDFEEDEYPFVPGELLGYYEGWEILHERQFTFDDDSDGVPHVHAAEEIIARKPEA